MKTTCSILIILIALCTGCSESDNSFPDNDDRAEFFKPVDPRTEVSRFSRELQINGENFEGDIPTATNVDNTFVSGFTSSASITSDNILFLPITFGTEDDVVEALVHIKNADNYWQLPVTPVNNSTNLQIGIPSHAMNGNFVVDYILIKSNGASSQVLETQVGIVSPESECSGFNFPTIRGNDGLTVKTYNLPDVGTGTLTISYNTFTIPDRVDIRYNDQWIRSTGNLLAEGEAPPVKDCQFVSAGDGFLGTSDSFTVPFDTNISRKLDIYVSGCLNNGTQWTVTVSCPQNDTSSGLWYENLPDCPCSLSEIPENNRTPGFDGEWSDAFYYQIFTSQFHYGATSEIRWVPDSPGAGQQCTFDADGNLITSGLAAGSPDRKSPGGFIPDAEHDDLDVQPWKANNPKTLPCTTYLEMWPSNQGNCGDTNPVNTIDHLGVIISNMSCEEVTTLFNIADSGSSFVPEDLALYLSGTNPNPPNNILDMFKILKSRLNCPELLPEQCSVIEKAILNLSS